MLDSIMFILVVVIAFFIGEYSRSSDIHDKCVAKYSYMPHNQVDAYCTELLKFQKDSK